VRRSGRRRLYLIGAVLLVVALVGGCDGTVPLVDQLTVLAAAHEVPVDQLGQVAEPIVAHLVERGFLQVVS